MPHIDETAKAWELRLSRVVGVAVQWRRKALKLTAQQLAERTKELGYPVTRVAISKIEGNKRTGKLDVAELLTLAAALEIPPALLLFPEYPTDEAAEVLPDYRALVPAAVDWLAGDAPLPVRVEKDGTLGEATPSNDGVALIAAYERRAALQRHHTMFTVALQVDKEGTRPEDPEYRERIQSTLRELDGEIKAVDREISQARTALWGLAGGPSDG